MKRIRPRTSIIESYMNTSNEMRINARNMSVAQISAGGQLNIPADLRRMLQLKAGNTLLFQTDSNGKITVKVQA